MEANPETVDEALLAALLEAGCTRLSLGMQSAAPHVLAVLERRHSPGRAVAAARLARAAGFEHVSLDLIYGTPGESRRRLGRLARRRPRGRRRPRQRLRAHGGAGHAHARARPRGALPAPDDDVQARRYRAADAVLRAAGFAWYEVASWAARPSARCAHNLGYWRSASWWGLGPGAHSHVGGVRWWNVLHPARYAERLASGASPAAGREVLTDEQRRMERIMLGIRLAEGLRLDDEAAADAAATLAADGLLDPAALARGRARLTLDGRLLADHVARTLVTARERPLAAAAESAA